MTAYLKEPLKADQPITTRKELHKHLYQAQQVELVAIPLYLYAAYSIKSAGDWQWDPGISAFRTIRAVAIEEMLHLCLARNLFVATGGPEMSFYDEHFVPAFPLPMPHREPPLQLNLRPCTIDQVRDVFMPFELPGKTNAPPQPDKYNTIGQFYAAIVDGLERLSTPGKWRDAHPELQYTSTYWNQDGGGSPLAVYDLPSALAAVRTIVEQGEGADPGDPMVPLHPAAPQVGLEEYSHYAKFSRIVEGIDLVRDLWPVPENPKAGDWEGPLRALGEFFNAAYCYVLCMIDSLYATPTPARIKAGDRSDRYLLERTFIAAMGGLLFPIADVLVRQPLDPAVPDGPHAAPTFEFYRFEEGRPKKDQLVEMCDGLLGTYPALAGSDGVRALLNKVPSVPLAPEPVPA